MAKDQPAAKLAQLKQDVEVQSLLARQLANEMASYAETTGSLMEGHAKTIIHWSKVINDIGNNSPLP